MVVFIMYCSLSAEAHSDRSRSHAKQEVLEAKRKKENSEKKKKNYVHCMSIEQGRRMMGVLKVFVFHVFFRKRLL